MHNLQLFARITTEEGVSFIFSPRPEDAHDKHLTNALALKQILYRQQEEADPKYRKNSSVRR